MALHAFIVEDSPVVRDNLIAALEEMTPVQVVGTADGEPAALDWLRRTGQPCDLLIVDLMLREGSGLSLLRELQGRPASACKRIVLSNYATEGVRHRCLQLGATAVFDKSCDIDTLMAFCAELASAPEPGGAAA
jgi:DNA-binding NarL/FixJ family response regulator